MGFVADTVSVDGKSKVLLNARVEGDVVLANSVVTGSAVVSGSVEVVNSLVGGRARVEGCVYLGDSKVLGFAHVYGRARVVGVRVSDWGVVFGDASLECVPNIIVVLRGEYKFGGSASFEGLNTGLDFVYKYSGYQVECFKLSSFRELVVLTDVWDMG